MNKRILFIEKEISNHFLRIKLKGERMNSSGLGTKVKIHHNGKVQFEDVSLYRGYLSTVENVIHFGLGTNASADSLTILWPDGKSQSLYNVKANQVLNIDYKKASVHPHTESDTQARTKHFVKEVFCKLPHPSILF